MKTITVTTLLVVLFFGCAENVKFEETYPYSYDVQKVCVYEQDTLLIEYSRHSGNSTNSSFCPSGVVNLGAANYNKISTMKCGEGSNYESRSIPDKGGFIGYCSRPIKDTIVFDPYREISSSWVFYSNDTSKIFECNNVVSNVRCD